METYTIRKGRSAIYLLLPVDGAAGPFINKVRVGRRGFDRQETSFVSSQHLA